VNRPAELFAIAAIGLLAASLVLHFLAPAGFLDIQFRHTAYAFSYASVFIFMAAFLCVCAAVYSFWIIPINQNAGIWHFWLTLAGIVFFWLSFYFLFVRRQYSTELHGSALAIATGWLASFVLILVAQGIFLVNLLSAIARLRACR